MSSAAMAALCEMLGYKSLEVNRMTQPKQKGSTADGDMFLEEKDEVVKKNALTILGPSKRRWCRWSIIFSLAAHAVMGPGKGHS